MNPRNVAVFLLLLLFGRGVDAGSEAASSTRSARELHALFQADWQRQLRENPLAASDIGDLRYNRLLPDRSPEAIAKQQAAVRGSLDKLKSLDREALAEADRLNYDIYRTLLEDSIAGFAFRTELMPVDQRGGVHALAVSAMQYVRFATARDYRDWTARLRGFGTYADQTIALMREGMRTGWIPPRTIMSRVPK